MGREPLGAVVGVGVAEVEEGLAGRDEGGKELLWRGADVFVGGGFGVGAADMGPAVGVGDLDAFVRGKRLLLAGHSGVEDWVILLSRLMGPLERWCL